MAISESQLEIWSHQGSIQQSAATYQTIKGVLESPNSPYYAKSFSVFLQGSYGNSTNIYADSDVDLVICLTSIYYSDTNSLTSEDKARYDSGTSSANYTFDNFKSDVLSWLKVNFGAGVKAGKKAIFVPGEGGRRDVDVLVCVKHHDYYSFPAFGSPSFHEGVCFWTSDGKIVNYPKQHLAHCTTKHAATYNKFKPNVRVIKNIRNSMIDKGYIVEGIAPSYFLEGMLYNVPTYNFFGSFGDSFEGYVEWLSSCNTQELLCANERHYLIRDGARVCWNLPNFRSTLSALQSFWANNGN
ncbi:nucleotidyltransferase domain-containing protein [Sphingopyxis panaciterrae]